MQLLNLKEIIESTASPRSQSSKHQFFLVLTLPPISPQTAREIARFSTRFRVVLLGSTKTKDGSTFDRQQRAYKKEGFWRADNFSDPLFDPKNPATSRTIAVASYLYLTKHHGPTSYYKFAIKHKLERSLPAERAFTLNPNPKWKGLLQDRIYAGFFDEAAEGLRNRSSFWFSIYWLGLTRKFLYSGSPSPRGLKDYVAYLDLIQTPEFNRKASRDDPEIGYSASTTDPYLLPDDHPAAIFRSASYCYQRWILDADLDEFDRGIKARKCLSTWLIRRDMGSACPLFSENTIARSLPPKRHFILETVLSPTGYRWYHRFEKFWIPRLMILRRSTTRPEDKGTPTPNGRSLRALAMLSFFYLLGFLHKDHPVDETVRNDAFQGIMPDDIEELNRDRHSFFYEKSEIFKSMPAISKDGQRIRWLFKTIFRLQKEFGTRYPPLAEADFDGMTNFDLATLFLSYSPKMAAAISLLQYHTVLRQEKVIVWFQTPFNQELCQEVLMLLGFKLYSMYSATLPESRDNIVLNFNKSSDKTMILLAGIKVGGTGLNLQHDSHVSIAMDAYNSLDQKLQTEGRQHRTGQVVECVFYQPIVDGTHDYATIR